MGEGECPECKSKSLIRNYEKAEIVCSKCGLVVSDELVDTGPEWRAFDADQRDKRARTGGPMKYTRLNKGLVTEIDRYAWDARGGKISAGTQAQMYRLRKWHKRASISSSMERNLAIALSELERMSSFLKLPNNIRESAALLYRKAVEKGLIRGRLIESVVASIIYTECRKYGVPRTLDEVAEASGLTRKEIGRTYRFISRELKINVPLTNPVNYIPRFASALGLSGEVQEKARIILENAVNKGLISGRGPTGVAAAAVYIAGVLMGERRTQKEVADVAGVTEVTIRNRYRELKKELDIDVNT
ncbi:MAG: transcription initiation factor IIB [Candidatus Diapherotrites archaeon]|nr:transcription initiation factor IIB [Candidatus Diapherotrites archaeon]